MPQRIQRKRTKGWTLPENTVYVGRPTKWGNPFLGSGAVESYRAWMAGLVDAGCEVAKSIRPEELRAALHELHGKNLACWCALDAPCHADSLLEMAANCAPGEVKATGVALYQYQIDSFHEKYSKSDGCWEWTGHRNNKGYGVLHVRLIGASAGKVHLAHRISWALANGEMPDGKCICHRCDNPICVRPDHLFSGTHKQNSQDMVAKRRLVRSVGDANGKSKITVAQVQEIRALAGTATLREIGQRFGLCVNHVCNIINGHRRNNESYYPQAGKAPEAQRTTEIGRVDQAERRAQENVQSA